MKDDVALVQRWQALCAQISNLSEKYPGRELCQLLAVSKYTDVASVRTLYQAGQKNFAENYWQAAQQKMQQLQDCDISWHFIGGLQSNQCAEIAQHFAWVHSLAKLKHVALLAKARGQQAPLQLCLQVNLSDDVDKYGALPNELDALVEAVLAYPNLHLRGLMILPKPNETKDFIELAKLRDQLTAKFKIDLPTLSMGMSGDYPQAIAAGSTMIRVGSALFGK